MQVKYLMDYNIVIILLYLYHAIEKTANKNAGNLVIFVSIPPNLPINQCNLTASHPAFPSGYCIFYGMV